MRTQTSELGPRLRARSAARALFLCAVLGVTGVSAAETSENLSVDGDGECPRASAVRDAIYQLTSPERRSVILPFSRVTIRDQGEKYEVVVATPKGSVARSYSDPLRECERRTRFAAVFAILTLMPPEIGAQEEPSLEPPKPPPPPPPPPEPVREPPPAPPPEPRSAFARIELGGVLEAAPRLRSAQSGPSYGGELRVALGPERIAGTASVGYRATTRLELGDIDADLSRVLGSAGVRARQELGVVAARVDLELLVAVEQVRARHLLHDASASGLDLGGAAGITVALPARARLAPFIGVRAALLPAARELALAPDGTIGRLPWFWLSGSLGLALEL